MTCHVTTNHMTPYDCVRTFSGSAMRYIARDLIPGEIYLFYVFTVADEEALVRSEPTTLVQGTCEFSSMHVEGI